MEFFNDTSSDPLKPTLFELVAQEQLRDLLQPALKYVLAVFAHTHPRYLLPLVNRHEEFYAFIMLLVERHYLRKHGASFAENFYGLKRRRRPYIEPERSKAATGGIPDGEKLGGKEMGRSLLLLVGLPYLRAKAQDYYEELGGGISPDILGDDAQGDARRVQALSALNFKGFLRRLFKTLYPYLNTGFELYLLAWNILYLFDKTAYYRPWLKWVGVDLRRLGAEDYRAAALSALSSTSPSSSTSPRTLSIFTRFRKLLSFTPHLLLDSLRFLLPTAIFFIKFLEWWYSPNSPARSLLSSSGTSIAMGPPVPPPTMLLPHPKGILGSSRSSVEFGICPLCRKPFTNPTALPSGYVFCYRCAYEHVEKEGVCPVTLVKVGKWEMRKVLV